MSWLRTQLEQSSSAALIKRFQSLSQKQKQCSFIAMIMALCWCLYVGAIKPIQAKLDRAQYNVDQAVEAQQLLVKNWEALKAFGQQETTLGGNVDLQRHLKGLATRNGIILDRLSLQGGKILVSTKESSIAHVSRFLEELSSSSIAPLLSYEIAKSPEGDGKVVMELSLKGES